MDTVKEGIFETTVATASSSRNGKGVLIESKCRCQ